MKLLEVKNLSIAVGKTPVVRNISFSIERKQTLGIVGESGCGKSLTSLAVMGLMDGTRLNITEGSIHFEGHDLLTLKAADRRKLMGPEMAMVFQEPMTSLNPVYLVGQQIVEMILQHEKISKKAAWSRAADLLKQVRIPDPESCVKRYPHQLSGGMRQRVVIAMALACRPSLLIADEPTTALDVTVQAQILGLLGELQRETGMAMILISHDLGVIAENCDRVAVMYRGQIIESAPVKQLFVAAEHPYTRGLIASIPDAQSDVEMLSAIPGRVPGIDDQISGCAFHPRCEFCQTLCKETPPVISGSDNHQVICHYPQKPAS